MQISISLEAKQYFGNRFISLSYKICEFTIYSKKHLKSKKSIQIELKGLTAKRSLVQTP
jgi:hypothetical protein